MYVTLVFWLALFLPGYALARRWFRDEIDTGLLSAVAVSYLLTLGVLSPVSILCYVLRAPVWVFAAGIVIAVVAALVDLTRAKAWRELAKLGREAVGIGLVVLLLDMLAGVLVGGHPVGDAQVHLARIRFLLDHGFSNLDPFVAVPYFYPIYHTNLLHALYAACSKLTGVDQFGVWYVGLAWAKLLVSSAVYHLATSTFRSRLAGWAAVMFGIVLWGPMRFTLYPNKIAPLFVMVVMFAVVVRMLADKCTWRRCLLLAIGSLLLGQIHGLYGAFAGLAFGPPLAVWGILAYRGKRPYWRRFVVAIAALTLAGPFLIVSMTHSRPRSIEYDTNHVRIDTQIKTENFYHFDGGGIMFKPGVALGNIWWYGLGILGVSFVLGWRSEHRRAMVALLAVVATVGLFLFVPPLCTLLLKMTQREWIVSRFHFVFRIAFVVLVPATVALFVERRVPIRMLRGPIVALVALAALPYGSQPAPLSWSALVHDAMAPAKRRHQLLEGYRWSADAVRGFIEPGSTVLTEPAFGTRLVMVMDCFIVIAHSTSDGVVDLVQRREDLDTMMDDNVPLERRAALLKQYDVRYFASPTGQSPRWPRDWVKGHKFIKPLLLVEFNQDAIGRSSL